ncbi:MAG TPA: hypothetical protein VFN30_14120 [Chitinophagaceae bacterium]|nr:hypothetical protein [Chitinophagaceae bacterium]
MAKKKKGITKANKTKLVKSVTALKDFVTKDSSLGGVTITNLYQVNNSANQVTFDLDFRNFGVSAVTKAELHDVNGTDVQLLNDVPGSLSNIPVGSNTLIDGKFLNIKSIVTASSQTPVPQNLNVSFSIDGGATTQAYPMPPAAFNNTGDSIVIDISIFFFHI